MHQGTVRLFPSVRAGGGNCPRGFGPERVYSLVMSAFALGGHRVHTKKPYASSYRFPHRRFA